MSVGKSVRLFLVDGTPGGLVTAEIMNWTGHVLAGPRSGIAELIKRPEARRTGIYVLLGEGSPTSPGGVKSYIGEGDDISSRLYEHTRSESKEFWNRAVLLTSKDANLTKAHARYLEARFIALGHQAARSEVTNGTSPSPPALPEADKSDMEYFITQALIALPVLGINIFRVPATSPLPSEHPSDFINVREFTLKLAHTGTMVRAVEIDGEFTVLAGSHARGAWIGTSASASYRSLREDLVREGAISVRDASAKDGAVFERDQVFASPSAAAAVVLGRASNGRKEWTETESQLSYGDWQVQSLEVV